jgi:hypothetical protein
MNVEQIRVRMRESFRPFSVVTSSGNKYAVPHPDFILITDRTVVVVDRNGYAANLDPLHIVAVEDIPTHSNGSRKRRGKRPD